jgi:alcohol dehydrogenase class IV
MIGFAGGSATDAGLAITALAPNSGKPLDYLEVIGESTLHCTLWAAHTSASQTPSGVKP